LAEPDDRVFLALFDLDGTLVDSQHLIVETMEQACAAAGVAAPTPQAVTRLVGLSLPRMIATLCPAEDDASRAKILDGYKARFAQTARAAGESRLYPGVIEGLARLRAANVTLGVATGKSKRGLDRLIAAMGWEGWFTTQQCADFHPSKPDPSMVQSALSETGVRPSRAVMIGDTSFDIEMARAAGVPAIAVGWGYHNTQMLRDAGADLIVPDFAALVDEIERRAA